MSQSSGPLPTPAYSNRFEALKISGELREVIKEIGYEHMTEIQAKAIPELLDGKDLIGQSKTGSGKTAAFSIPVLQKTDVASRRVQALILCPTRELCSQVAREIRRLGRKSPGLQVITLCGGMPFGPQALAVEKGVHIVVGTPGRIQDHLRRATLSLSSIRTVVLDEADRMLDMGFQDDMEGILKACPPRRQTVFFSATFPDSIEDMSAAYQRAAVRVTVSGNEAKPDIHQVVYEAAVEHKPAVLKGLLAQISATSTIIFCNLKTTTVELAADLAKHGLSAAALNGDLMQIDRDKVLARFRNQSLRILVATDVAARGIDIQGLDLVVNYDLPSKVDAYVHRIGRTGRAGRKGLAISLAAPRENFRIEQIEELTGVKMEREVFKALDKKLSAAEKPVEALMATIHINGGRKQKLRPGDILGALTGDAGQLQASDVGKIEIHDTFAYVAVSSRLARRACEALQDGRIKGRKFTVNLVR
jgi:ATP-independent RNA helicase DbpA